MDTLKEQIREEALRLGFSFCGFARNESLETLRPFHTAFIQRKGHAELGYLEANLEKRLNPELLLKGAKSVIALLLNYYPEQIIPEADNFIIAKYAYGRDYHLSIHERLEKLIVHMKSIAGGNSARAFVDSGPVLEKVWAQKCGLGWQGKNTLIINNSAGSFFFIGIILTNLEIEPDAPETNHCGKCVKCVNACPTGALDMPYQLDLRRCISYMTIENKGDIPDELTGKFHDRIYGCDICQDACPYNCYAPPHSVYEFIPSESLMRYRKKDWQSLTEHDFDRIFAGSPIKRIGYQKLMRNIRAVSG